MRKGVAMFRRGNGRQHRKVRYGVVGLGHIAQSAMLPAFKHARSNSELTALVSDNPKKLRKLGKKYGVKHLYSYDRFDDCLKSGNIDAVYIALPNDMHRDFTLHAAASRVHVLCEKPMALTEQDCEEMILACRENSVKLMIAYRLHYERASLAAARVMKSGLIGEPRIFHSLFTMQVTDKDNIRLQRAHGGGTLYDIGIYCINTARMLFRDEPIEVFAFSANSGDRRFREVDEMTGAILRFPKERLATLVTSFGAANVSAYQIVGTKGNLRLDPGYEIGEALIHHLTVNGRRRRRVFSRRDQFAPLLIKFSECILKDLEPEPSGLEGLADVRVIRALMESAEARVPIRLRDFVRKPRPAMEQEITRPPVEKPELIHARPPH